jgi:hypothetical protein
MEYETITISQLMALYLDIITNYEDEFWHIRLADGGIFDTPSNIMWAYSNEFINLENQTSNLTDARFIEFPNNFRAAYEWLWLLPDRGRYVRRWSHNSGVFFNHIGAQPPAARLMAQEFAFLCINQGLSPAFKFFEHYEEQPFLHGIPLVNSEGALYIDMPNRFINQQQLSVSISAAADTELAWEFTKHFLDRVSNQHGRGGHNAPIKRENFTAHAQTGFRGFIGNLTMHDTSLLDHYTPQIPYAVSSFYNLTQMPMTRSLPPVPYSLWSDDFELFCLDVISAETFAQRFQNRVALWLIE